MSELKKPPFPTGPSVQSIAGNHWSSISFASDLLTDAVIKHTLGLCHYGMADTGEIFEILCRLNDKRLNPWKYAFGEMAERLQARAQASENQNHRLSAASAYLRAATYWRIATMCFDHVTDADMVPYTKSSFGCYEKYLSLSRYPGTYVEIPYETTYLPAHFYRSPCAQEKAPLLIVTPGRDTWAEDTRWVSDSALKRGIHCLVYDGPGQGYALRLQGMKFRSDWEHVLSPVIDYAEQIPGVDRSNILCMGMSFGGFLIPRAAAFDQRIKLCITDPGNLNWGAGICERLEMILNMPPSMRPKFMSAMLEDYAWKHGVPENQIVEELKHYDNRDILDKIACKVLVLDGTTEINTQAAKEFYDALQCPKDYLLFDENTTAQCHTQMGGYAAAAEILFDWIEENI